MYLFQRVREPACASSQRKQYQGRLRRQPARVRQQRQRKIDARQFAGPLHGGAPAQLAQLLALAESAGAPQAVGQWLASGRALPGFGHPLYPAGDPRAGALRPLLPEVPAYTALAAAAREQAGELPSIDFALSLLAHTCRLPPDAPLILFAMGRCAGWLAHALEQVQTGQLIRPRARYVGPMPLQISGT